MKTSMALLKATQACVGGFTRQASFFTVRPKAKAVEYPIWMVGLIGSFDDLQWAISNSLIVEDEEFKALKERTFWPMFQALFWQRVDAAFILKWSKEKPSIYRTALNEALKIKDAEAAREWMAKYSRLKISSPLFSYVCNHACWHDPQSYMQTLTERMTDEKNDLCLEHERLPFDLDSHVPGHNSATGKPVKVTPPTGSIAARRAAARRRDEDGDESDDEGEGEYSSAVKKKEAPTATPKVTFFELPYDLNGRIITNGERFAAVCVNGDPWSAALEFMLQNNVPKAIGSKVNVTKVSPDGVKPPQFAASLHLNDPRKIFMIMHLLQGMDFDVLKACMVEPQASQLQSLLSNYGKSPDDECESNIVGSLEYTMACSDEYAKRKITEGIARFQKDMRDGQPTAGAIPERTVRVGTTAVVSDETDDEEAPAEADGWDR